MAPSGRIWGRDTGGEACFNTSMTGYQEILTDPLIFQIVTMMQSRGNYGVNAADVESDGPKLRGFVVREVSPLPAIALAIRFRHTYRCRY